MKKKTAKRIADAFAECVVHRVDAIVQPFREVIDGVATDARAQTEAVHQRLDDLLEKQRQGFDERFNLVYADQQRESQRVDGRIDLNAETARSELASLATLQGEQIGQGARRVSEVEARVLELAERIERLERARRAS